MTQNRRRAGFAAAYVVAMAALCPRADAQGITMDEAVAPGRNYDKAEFRLWYPDAASTLRAVVVLAPGSNGDGRAQVDDRVWQAFAAKHQLALLGVRLTDKPHDQAFIEHYVNVSERSGQAVLDVLTVLARRTGHPELPSAPLLLWGMSAGGEFNYEFVNWKPERVIGFVVNKGGIYDHRTLRAQSPRRCALGAGSGTGRRAHRRPFTRPGRDVPRGPVAAPPPRSRAG